MDSTSRSSTCHGADADRLERPLPPLPSPEIRMASEERISRVSDAPPLAETPADEEFHNSHRMYGAALGVGHGGDYTQQGASSRNRSQSSSNLSPHRSRSASNSGSLQRPHASGSNEDLYLAEDSTMLSRTSSIHGGGAARSLRLSENPRDATPRSRSHSQTLVQTLQLLQPSTSRNSSDESGSDESQRGLPAHSHTSSSQARRRQRQAPDSEAPNADFVLPRWQPDIEVTMCPICRTQFSFFIRKHHCRKCGRVVCSSCSPHRITIPHQYIVQPTIEGVSPTTDPQGRPSIDSRSGSSNQVGGLGGGERVRLCNPCVPDPNTAPPQSPVPHRQSSQRSHSRAASTAASYASSDNYRSREEIERLMTNFPRRQQDSSIAGGRPPPPNGARSANFTVRDDRSLRPDPSESRSRSSTVGNARGLHNTSQYFESTSSFSTRVPQGTNQQPFRPLIPRNDDNNTQAFPHRPRQVERRRIPEEDECWICHLELPSRTLDNFEKLRENHVESCLAAAMGGSNSPVPSATLPARAREPSVRAGSSNNTSQSQASSSTAISVPVANTPEARMAAREQAHAAIVFGHGQSGSPGPARRTGVFPYQATEKDCVDDAECTICLEEFVPGVEMGRLECFCRFHLHCIRQWFENHPGQCPVHQHGAGY